MANGITLRDENVIKFRNWIASMSDSGFKQIVHRGILKRKEIAKECDFSVSVFRQNPIINRELKDLEESLRKPERGVLPQIADKVEAAMVHKNNGKKETIKQQRLKRLEQDNAVLRAKVRGLEDALNRLNFMDKVLAETGRLPR